jgi:hypothetical protein
MAQQAPHNLAEGSGAVFSSGVAALATLLLPKKVRPTHLITVAGALSEDVQNT